jgi:L,D-transpeptidase catalytic domain
VRKLTGLVIAAGVAAVLLSACSSATKGASTPAATSSAAISSAAISSAAGAAVAAPKIETAPSSVSSTPVAPRLKPRPKNFCAANTSPQKVIVNVHKQHAWMCAKHTDVFDTAITTGIVGEWTSTPTGTYQIQGRTTNTVLTLNTGAQYDVKYWIPFDAPLFGFHDSSWQNFPYGSAKYKTQGSHGCIHMPLKAMKFLYNWSARPTDVHIA